MFGPDQLTHVVYMLLPIAGIAVAIYVVVYHLRQREALKKAERAGAHPHSVDEGILMALHQAEIDRLEHAHHHA